MACSQRAAEERLRRLDADRPELLQDVSQVVTDALQRAMAEAASSNAALKARAWQAVTALQEHIQQDGGVRALTAGRKLQLVLSEFAPKAGVSPGELALVLVASVHSVLMALPGMTPELARAISVELASGPRGE